MSELNELLASLRKKQVRLTLRGPQLLFDAPMGSLSDEDLGMIQLHKDAIITLLQKSSDGQSLPQLTKQRRGAHLPLSYAQQRLWFLDNLGTAHSAYNVILPMRLRGVLSFEALSESLTQLVSRHEILRTRFNFGNGQGEQIVEAPRRVSLDMIDLTSLSSEVREQSAQERIQKDALRPFDLKSGPLFRVLVLRLSAQEHVLLLTMHHIITDEWSTDVLMRELTALYNGSVQGEPSLLGEPEIQYADVALWQRQSMESGALDGQLTYWKRQLSGIPKSLDLPTDRSRPTVASYRGSSHRFTLHKEAV